MSIVIQPIKLFPRVEMKYVILNSIGALLGLIFVVNTIKNLFGQFSDNIANDRILPNLGANIASSGPNLSSSKLIIENS